MSCGKCDSDMVTYRCSACKSCPPKKVKASDPVPMCCGAPMKKEKS